MSEMGSPSRQRMRALTTEITQAVIRLLVKPEGLCLSKIRSTRLWMRTSALRYSVAGEAVVQEVGERQWQVQQRREFVGVERDQNRTQHRGEGTDQDGGVHHLVIAVDQLRQEQPEDQGELEDRRHHHQRRYGKRGVHEGLGDGD